MPHTEIKLYLSAATPCSYLPGRTSQSIVVDPNLRLSTSLYSLLAVNGFRRSGDMVYKPNCAACQACVPIRIPVEKFKPTRAQQRNLKKNHDISVSPHPPVMNNEHFALYSKYQALRHTGSSMCDPSPEEYLSFLTSRQVETVFYEFRIEQKLVAVAVTDILDHGLSAVYTFYEPDLAERGLGTFAILWQCQQAKILKLPWLYLGYWVARSQKMAYKINFQPAEGLQNQRWQPIFPETEGSAG